MEVETKQLVGEGDSDKFPSDAPNKEEATTEGGGVAEQSGKVETSILEDMEDSPSNENSSFGTMDSKQKPLSFLSQTTTGSPEADFGMAANLTQHLASFGTVKDSGMQMQQPPFAEMSRVEVGVEIRTVPSIVLTRFETDKHRRHHKHSKRKHKHKKRCHHSSRKRKHKLMHQYRIKREVERLSDEDSS